MLPADQIISSINSIWISSILLCFVCIAFSLIIIFIISGNITKRIARLIDSINMVWRGNYKITAEPSGNDEIGYLESNFYKMIQKIDTLINEVYEASLNIKDAEIRQQRIEMEKKEAMIIGLQGQINPHYLFNTLETIRMNLVLKGEREIARIVKLFAKSFRLH
jgi:two-component system sensor histidine kinase YesM